MRLSATSGDFPLWKVKHPYDKSTTITARIPVPALVAAGLVDESRLAFRVEDRKIVIERVK